MTRSRFRLATAALLMLSAGLALCQPSALTYQGQLRDGGVPVTGTVNLEFRLYDQLTGGSQIGASQTRPNWPVEDGLFQVGLDFGGSAFNGVERYLEVRVNGTALVPRQRVTATPYALLAGGLVGGVPETGWSLTGNAGTGPGNFLGTTDDQPLTLRAGGVQALRIEPGFSGSSNVIGGAAVNQITPGVGGGTIAGGGSDQACGSQSCANLVLWDFGSIGGGWGNQVGGQFGTIAGGDGNSTAGYAAVVSGGARNNASGGISAVGGGGDNTASGLYSMVGGGRLNSADELYSTVGGGSSNTASGARGTVGGGGTNIASGSRSTVGGGSTNIASSTSSTVAGGDNNAASGNLSTIGGGAGNRASGSASAVGGGAVNNASAIQSSIAGGELNTASGLRSTVMGGSRNTSSGSYSAVGGGHVSCAGGSYSWVGGRRGKVRPGSSSGDGGFGCEGTPSSGDADGDNGTFLWADSQDADFVSTGPNKFLVRADGGFGFNTNAIPSGIEAVFQSRGGPNINTDLYLRTAAHGRGINLGMLPTAGAAEFRIAQFDGTTFTDRLFLFSNGDFQVTAQAFKPGGGSWASSSDRRLKSDIEPLTGALERMLSLSGVTFEYTDPDPARRPAGQHIGFIAQDVAEVFPAWVETDRDGFLTVGSQGFEALTVEAMRELRAEAAEVDQGQNRRLDELAQENARLRAQNDALESRLAKLEALLGSAR